MNTAISLKNIGKAYTIRHQEGGYIALRDVLSNAVKAPMRAITGRKNHSKEEFWALDDVSFTVEKGEAVGIIGANGAGKSTLLKVLSQITPPTKGEARIEGRVSSLLEVGTGFHPELTGRENVFLNGSILGMTRREIREKFDEIASFAGVEHFLDTPVKRYSSGMQVRLAFAVAAHLDPDILIIDEVLAVGDAAFQQKSFAKMEQVTREQNRTILMVSHNMQMIQKLCERTILLENGKIKRIGKTQEVIAEYLELYGQHQGQVEIDGVDAADKPITVNEIIVRDKDEKPGAQIDVRDPFSIDIMYTANDTLKQSYVGVGLMDLSTNRMLLDTLDIDTNPALYEERKAGKARARFSFPAGIFNEGHVKLFVHVGTFPTSKKSVQRIDGAVAIAFEDKGSFATTTLTGKRAGQLLMAVPCSVTSI